MRRLLWAILGVLALAGLALSLASAHWKTRAFQLYHGGKYHTRRSLQAPALVAERARQLESDWKEFQRLQPGLAVVKGDFMGQPSSLLYRFGMQALKDGNLAQFERATRLLNEIWLQARDASQVDLEALQTLDRWQQSVLSFYARCAVQGGKAELPSIDPRAWPGRISLAHRLLVSYRVKRWDDWEDSPGIWTWAQACDCLERLDRWHQELDSGQVLTPPSPELQPLYEGLLKLQKGP